MSMASLSQSIVCNCFSFAIPRDLSSKTLAQMPVGLSCLSHGTCCATLRKDALSKRTSVMLMGFSSQYSRRGFCFGCCTMARDPSSTFCATFSFSCTHASGSSLLSRHPESCGISSLAIQCRQGLGFDLSSKSQTRGPAPPSARPEDTRPHGQSRINRISPPGLGQFRPPSTGYVPPLEESEEEKHNASIKANALIEKLRDGHGSWQERAGFVKELQKLGVTSEDLYSLTFVPIVTQLEIVVAAQVYDSLVQSGASPEILEQFDESRTNLLYALRTLSARQRRSAAEYVMENSLSVEEAQKLAWAIKDHERRPAGRKAISEWFASSRHDFLETFWVLCGLAEPLLKLSKQGFTTAPGDCLAFMFHRQAVEAQDIEQKRNLVDQGLKVAVTETAKERFSEFSF